MYALWLCAVSVCVGLNWAVLQVVAWAGMTMTNAHTMGLSGAFEKAIEGQKGLCNLPAIGAGSENDG